MKIKLDKLSTTYYYYLHGTEKHFRIHQDRKRGPFDVPIHFRAHRQKLAANHLGYLTGVFHHVSGRGQRGGREHRRHRPQKERCEVTFEQAHETGSHQFGILWLRANEAAIRAAEECKMTVSNPINKRLLSLVTLYILQEAREQGTL